MALDPISALQGSNAIGLTEGTASKSSAITGDSFKQYLLQSLEQVNQMQADSEAAQEALVTGRTDDVTQVMSAVEKADIAFNTLMSVRNKLVEAYQEVLRMQI